MLSALCFGKIHRKYMTPKSMAGVTLVINIGSGPTAPSSHHVTLHHHKAWHAFTQTLGCTTKSCTLPVGMMAHRYSVHGRDVQ